MEGEGEIQKTLMILSDKNGDAEMRAGRRSYRQQ